MTAAAYVIPLSSIAQRFEVPLSNTRLQMQFIWRNRGGVGWVLDLFMEDGTTLVQGIPLVVGHDLLEQHRHLGIVGGLFVIPNSGDDVPTFDNLGTDVRLFYITP